MNGLFRYRWMDRISCRTGHLFRGCGRRRRLRRRGWPWLLGFFGSSRSRPCRHRSRSRRGAGKFLVVDDVEQASCHLEQRAPSLSRERQQFFGGARMRDMAAQVAIAGAAG